MKQTGIYVIKNTITGQFYVGSAKNIKKRKYIHFYKLGKNIHHNKYLQNSFNYYGIEVFEFKILETCDKNLLIKREQYWIDKYFDDQKQCFNMNKDASSWFGRKHSIETRRKLSQAHKGKKINKKTRKKMSLSHQGLRHTEKSREKIGSKTKARQSKPFNCPQWGKKGKNSAYKKVIVVLFESGEKKSFPTIREAAKHTNVNPCTITRAIKGRKGRVKNFVFSFVDENSKKPKKKTKNNFGCRNPNSKKVSVINVSTNKEKVFETIIEAAKEINSPPSSISRAIHNKGKIKNFEVKLLT